MLIMNEKIKASEVELTGLNGEALGIVPRAEALELAKRLKADLVCASLLSSPPPCKLVARGQAKQERQQEKKQDRAEAQSLKTKEIRFTPHIEDHDYETKLRQAEKLLQSGRSVQLVVRLTNAKEGQRAKELLEAMLKDLQGAGTKKTAVQTSGKQAAVLVLPR